MRERFGGTGRGGQPAGGVILNPPPDILLRPGDDVRVFGLPDQIAAFVTEAGTPR